MDPTTPLFPEGTVHSVSEVNRMLKDILEADDRLRVIAVWGELSNFKHHVSGHMYFTLKDEYSRLRCVMFRSRNQRVRFRPQEGMSVVAVGSVSMYEAGGDVQLYVEHLFPEGLGRFYAAFEALKEKLAAEGLFDPVRKRPLPALPRRVGVVTSPSGAAIRDIISVLSRRFPGIEIVLSPAQVQGDDGPRSVIAALDRLRRWGKIDVLIVGRGGGSPEELWTFNDEGVARALADFPVPVVSAVGHETDVTIADFVADRRAPTPSAAAEMVVPEKGALQRYLGEMVDRLVASMRRRLHWHRDRLRLVLNRPVFRRPEASIAQRRQQVDELAYRCELALDRIVQGARSRLEAAAGRLHALSPLATLGRGFALCERAATGELVRAAGQVAVGERVRVRLAEGGLDCTVEGSWGDGER